MEYKDMFLESNLPQPYTEEELYARFQDMNNGDLTARKDIIEHSIRLVLKVVIKKFYNTPYEANELVAVGLIGLIKSIDTYNVNQKVKFMTYAITCIRNEIIMYMRKGKKHVGIYSLEDTFHNGGEHYDLEYGEIIADDKGDFVTDYENKEVYRIIREVVSKLPERNRKVISMYFGFDNNGQMSQHEIAKVLGLSQTYIYKIINTTLSEISKDLEKQGIIEVKKGFYKRYMLDERK